LISKSRAGFLNGLLAGSVIAATTFVAPVASASEDPPSIPPDAQQAISRIKKTRKVSKADRATILRYPSIAKMLVDPTSGKLSLSTASKAAAPNGCHTADRYIAYRTMLGAKSYDWHSVINYCWSNGKVSVLERYHFMGKPDSFVHDGALVLDSQAGEHTGIYQSRMQGKVENKFLTVDWVANYPRIDYRIYGKDGRYTVTQTS